MAGKKEMKIWRFPLGRMQANCYFLIKENCSLIIDPADEASFILEKIQRERLKIVGLLATHGHFDHLMAAGEIQVSLEGHAPSLQLFVHPNDMFLVKRLKETSRYFLGYEFYILEPNKIEQLKIGDLQIGEFSLKVITTPGHTPGSCCFYFKDEGIIFTGDTLFKNGIGRYDFSYSSKLDLFKSLGNLFKLPETTIVYPGHGEETVIKLLSHF